ncbi:hypothetical protein [Candidatus Symbiopectobacterium endolongispinus]|uniref:hypothetical protein n=1 Tax=Candidatus Symbiopectobacterium endolongispinus TaxID=2812664 RepID=UPI0020796FF4|nr:hypothetical protein [Candidatus Symbiopectobacterium endolongispinus]
MAIEGIDAENVTTELLLNQLSDEDFDLIDAQISALKKADGIESALAGYRSVVLALGKYGITRQQIEVMSRSELDGYIQALARLHGKNPSAGDQTTRRVKSMRQKRPRKPNKKGRR